jgi:hypothetical protein
MVVSEMTPVPVEGGRAWEFTHDGIGYQLVSDNGSDLVKLYYRTPFGWEFWRAQRTCGRGALSVAKQMRAEVVSMSGAAVRGTPGQA